MQASPFEYLMACMRSEAGAAYFDIPLENVPMAARTTVRGTRAGENVRLVYEAQDFSRRATTSAAAQIALMLLEGEIDFAGVRAPEGCVDAETFLSRLAQHPDIKFFAWENEDEPAPLLFER